MIPGHLFIDQSKQGIHSILLLLADKGVMRLAIGWTLGSRKGLKFAAAFGNIGQLLCQFSIAALKIYHNSMFKATQVYYLTVLQIRSLTCISLGKNGGFIGLYSFLEIVGENPFPWFFSPNFQRLPALLSSWSPSIFKTSNDRISPSHMATFNLSILSPTYTFKDPCYLAH